ncbi:MAG: RNA polymerase sigma factor [Terrimicrobiaceae bacterium]|nr:RNA polymerase sigma factor [Terrimicrobiaceae bacterium]
MSPSVDFECLVRSHYRDLYHFAFSLVRNPSEASDLVQETFHIWAKKGTQLREQRSAKSWLFTTLHRLFLQACRHQTRFPEIELTEAQGELPDASVDPAAKLDSEAVLKALEELDPGHRAPLALYYLEDYSYREIAGILEVPLGTVQSRISRGKARLLEKLTGSPGANVSEGGAK